MKVQSDKFLTAISGARFLSFRVDNTGDQAPDVIRNCVGGQIFLSDLQRYFSGLGNAPPESEGGAGAAGGVGAGAGAAAGARIDLGAALASPEVVATATAPGNAARLQPHLPPAAENAPQDDVRTTLLSPQFAQVNPITLAHTLRARAPRMPLGLARSRRLFLLVRSQLLCLASPFDIQNTTSFNSYYILACFKTCVRYTWATIELVRRTSDP